MDLKQISTQQPGQIGSVGQNPNGNRNQNPAVGSGPSFADILNTKGPQKLEKSLEAKASEGIKFSNHAIERLRTRGIPMGPDELARLSTAVEKATAKGAKDTLVLMGNSALIVNIKNKTVVTAMDAQSLKENVFTNIDSTIVI